MGRRDPFGEQHVPVRAAAIEAISATPRDPVSVPYLVLCIEQQLAGSVIVQKRASMGAVAESHLAPNLR
jgi:hypothetical protein